jgi:hypothetical protein
MRTLTCAVVLIALNGCGKTDAGTSAGVDAGGSADAGVSASADASAAPRGGVVSWKGTYKSAEAGITLPKDVKWRVPESTAGVGDGTLAFTVDPASGRVQGTLDGVLGPATLDGFAADRKVTAIVVRKDPSDQGFTGTLEGELADATGRGSVRLALADTSAVRLATFELTPASP